MISLSFSVDLYRKMQSVEFFRGFIPILFEF